MLLHRRSLVQDFTYQWCQSITRSTANERRCGGQQKSELPSPGESGKERTPSKPRARRRRRRRCCAPRTGDGGRKSETNDASGCCSLTVSIFRCTMQSRVSPTRALSFIEAANDMARVHYSRDDLVSNQRPLQIMRARCAHDKNNCRRPVSSLRAAQTCVGDLCEVGRRAAFLACCCC